ncbi:LTA synthase family protein [Fervidibacillus halotolerans]|uniref:LTA synthase family protein n=1 Tax=Fervidibacillus halotolerans TaxID=2980027 RepID=A0A9E8RXQ1_9BACI|nr:LTA synthase family protein [Fervidibacillus halotolerans]WAA11459.1 LTA synthase family protein [Fervidibacillus halotolerans]
MKLLKQSKFSPILFATVLLWVKTYITYKVAFNITIDNKMQEFILLISPVSFLLIVFGLSMFINEKYRNKYLFSVSLITSLILYANIVFYRFFNDFITIPVMFQTGNFHDLDISVMSEMNLTDIFYFTDVIILAIILYKKPKFWKHQSFSKVERRVYYLTTASIVFFNLGLAEIQRPELLTRTFDREMLVKNIGPYNYTLYDIYLQSKTSAQKALATGDDLVEILNYTRSMDKEPNQDLFGIGKGKNIILISLESTQNFVINRTVNGQEITPFLNDFIKESYYFDNFYHQTGQGKTSDSEFLLDNSLYPLGRGAVFFTHAGNEYISLAKILKENNYYVASFHANNKAFWNRNMMYQSLGYDRFYSLEDYDVTEENSIGWGLKDIHFFKQSMDYLKEIPKPYFAKFITLTNHHPFILDEKDMYIQPFHSSSDILNRYFTTVRYEDEAVKTFIERLKEEGIYDDSIIIMYGDHYGISEKHNEALGEYFEKEITPFDVVELQKVPLIIHIPGQKGETISTLGGQIDLKPTILHLLGIEKKTDIHFGQDLFSPNKDNPVIFRDGRFVTDKITYTTGTFYDTKTGEPIDVPNGDQYIQKILYELNYSDQIIYGDLLRFYDVNTGRIIE